MHTGYYFGTFLAAIVNYTVGAHYGWRAVFAVGGTFSVAPDDRGFQVRAQFPRVTQSSGGPG